MLPADHDFGAFSELNVILYASWVLMGFTPVVFIALMCFAVSPYGRYTVDSNSVNVDSNSVAPAPARTTKPWSKATVPAKVAWVLQESPAFLVAAGCFYLSGRSSNIRATVNNILLWLFLAHYFQRSFIYPLLIRGGKPFPVSTFLEAMFFCMSPFQT